VTCHNAGMAVTLPNPMTYRIAARPASVSSTSSFSARRMSIAVPCEKLRYYDTNEENGQKPAALLEQIRVAIALKHRMSQSAHLSVVACTRLSFFLVLRVATLVDIRATGCLASPSRNA
jgi:hypothetical protein